MTTTSGERATQLLLQLLATPEGRRDPYPLYRALREEAPVLRSSYGPVVLSRFDDCQAALRDPRLGKAAGPSGVGGQDQAGALQEELGRQRASSMLFANPPEHTRLRRLVSRAFTPSRVEALRPGIEGIVSTMLDQMLDAMVDAGEVDVMSALAFPLPVTVIGELLGVPEADRAGFQPLVRDAVAALEIVAEEAALSRAVQAQRAMGAYFTELLAERRSRPCDDLLSAMIQAREHDDVLTEEEVVVTAILLFAAGFETTTNLIGNGLLALLQHPDQMRRLVEEPVLTPLAVEEMLRWDSPVQLDARVALDAVEVAGQNLERGEWVVTLLGGANRDPARFVDPERFDVARAGPGPLSFGSGIHHCLGAPLARLEGAVVFGALTARMPNMELVADEPDWRPNLTLRGLNSLAVRTA